jgi:ribonucleoside-triphosphate reductase (formate)
MENCNAKVEVFSRVVGYFRPVARWNDGKKEEFSQRKTFSQKKALGTDFGKIQEKQSC